MIRRMIAAVALAGVFVAVAVAPSSAHNYWYANWSTCTYDYYREVSRPTGTHVHQYQYSVAMPANYCTG